MLVLSRKEGQRVFIGRDVCVEVLGVRAGGRVALGITAPSSLIIMREELLTQMVTEAAEAAAGSRDDPQPEFVGAVA